MIQEVSGYLLKYIPRHVPKSKNLGGHVVMRRAAAAGGVFWSAKIWGGMCSPCPPPFGTCLIPMYVVWCPTWSKESEVSLLMPVKFRDLISNYSAKIFEYWMLSKQNILSCSLFSFRITLFFWPRRNLTKTNFIDDRFLCFLRKIARTQKIVKQRL